MSGQTDNSIQPSSCNHLLSTYYVQDIVLCSGNTREDSLCLQSAHDVVDKIGI